MWSWFLLGVVIIFFAAYFRSRAAAQRVQTFLESVGARNIVIRSAGFYFEWATGTYEVEYTDVRGQRRQDRCKVGLTNWDKEIYWADAGQIGFFRNEDDPDSGK